MVGGNRSAHLANRGVWGILHAVGVGAAILNGLSRWVSFWLECGLDGLELSQETTGSGMLGSGLELGRPGATGSKHLLTSIF